MAAHLLEIPLEMWVRGTISKMNSATSVRKEDWKINWVETYKELGGKRCKDLTGRKGSGDKECPMWSAYGLWRLGRIVNTNVAFEDISIIDVKEQFGPNAAYAVIALDLLENNPDAKSCTSDELWLMVKDSFASYFQGEKSAKSEQGAIRVAAGLVRDKQISFRK